MADATQLDALMGRLADGDRSAFSPLFRALWEPALKVCQRLVHSEADAADAGQAAMMKILERAGEYDKKRPALPWALGIAAWECRTLMKRRQRLKESAEEPVRSDEGSTAEQVEQKLLVSAAMEAMGSLSDADQETLISTYWDTAPLDPARGERVGGATLRKRRERALTRLRDTFRRLYGLD